MGIPSLIALWPVAPVVRLAVHFDAKPGFETREIERVRIKWKLPSKFEAARSLAKLHP